MIFIALDTKQIKLFLLKKTLLGQFEVDFFEKQHEVALLENGMVQSVDVLASAIKEGLTHLSSNQEKEVALVLPQQSFHYLKVDVPADIAQSAVLSFVQDKARAAFQFDLDECHYDYFSKENGGLTQVSFFAIEKDKINAFAETLSLLGLKLMSVIPDSLSYFKLFEKTLRAEKRENIFYVKYEKNRVDGFLYDSGGMLDSKKWTKDIDEPETIESVLKAKAAELEEKSQKLNRIILSGEQSENVRQDTFTKDVGVWTNPLKRIVPNFYDEYVKMLVVPPGKIFPLLTYDTCFGAFIFANENKQFQLLKKGGKIKISKRHESGGGGPRRGFPLFRKEVLIFIAAFGISFFAFVALTRSNFKFSLPSMTKASPTPTPPPPTPEPTAIPTPGVKKEEVKINVQNGSGTGGVAATARAALRKAGFAEILTENADNFDYTTTEIQIKKGFESFTEDLKKALAEGGAASPKVSALGDDETSDVNIILGADYK